MKLTARGWIVAGLIVISYASAYRFGPRGLNAIVGAGTITLIFGALQVYRMGDVSMTRYVPTYGTIRDTIQIRVLLRTEKPFNATATDSIPTDLAATNNTQAVSIDETTLRYDLSLDERGEHQIGPLRLTAEDVLGLVKTNRLFNETSSILVRPTVYLLDGPRRDDLVQLYGESGDDRLQFSQLREYRRGDPVRDIHWKSSAKNPGPDLVVKEFTADEGTRTVEIAAGAAPDCDDMMADAAASIALHLLDAGVNVGLTTPHGRIDPFDATNPRNQILDHLARTGHGRINTQYNPQILINATRTGVYIDIEGRKSTFDELAGRSISGASQQFTKPLTQARRLSESLAS